MRDNYEPLRKYIGSYVQISRKTHRNSKRWLLPPSPVKLLRRSLESCLSPLTMSLAPGASIVQGTKTPLIMTTAQGVLSAKVPWERWAPGPQHQKEWAPVFPTRRPLMLGPIQPSSLWTGRSPTVTTRGLCPQRNSPLGHFVQEWKNFVPVWNQIL